jgi:uncharacterized membrane protein YjfL (UPF0719 family)
LDLWLLGIGIAKILVGAATAVTGVWLATWLLGKLLGFGSVQHELKKGNNAVAVVVGSAILSLGLLAQHGIMAAFDAMDLLVRGSGPVVSLIPWVVGYGLVHIGASLLLGIGAISVGSWIFTGLTREVDEVSEVRNGNVAPALVLGAMMVLMAIMMGPGLQGTLEGLLPWPSLGRFEVEPF